MYFDKAIKSFELWVVNKTFHSCRLCDSCGGDYPISGGGGLTKNYWMSYADKCTGNSLYATSTVPQICCTADQPQCSWCESCGGEFPAEIGKKYNSGMYGNFNALGLTCSRSKGFFESTAEVSLCCRSDRQCKMCSGACGGNYQSRGSKIDSFWSNGKWGAFSDSHCNEIDVSGFAIDSVVGGNVNLCCLD